MGQRPQGQQTSLIFKDTIKLLILIFLLLIIGHTWLDLNNKFVLAKHVLNIEGGSKHWENLNTEDIENFDIPPKRF